MAAGVNNLEPGAVLNLKGIHNTGTELDFRWSGTPENPITIQAQPGEEAIVQNSASVSTIISITGNYVDLIGLDIEGPGNSAPAITVNGRTGVNIYDNTISHTSLTHYAGAIYVTNSANIVIRNNSIKDAYRGIHVDNTANLIIDRNDVEGITERSNVGINLTAVTDVLISNNNIYSFDEMCVYDCGFGLFLDNTTNTATINNTFHNSRTAVQITNDTNGEHSFINNIIHGTDNLDACQWGVIDSSGSATDGNPDYLKSLTSDTNAFTGNVCAPFTYVDNLNAWVTYSLPEWQSEYEQDANSFVSKNTPFVSSVLGSEDLHLNSNSECIDTGTDVSDSVTTDIDYQARPAGSAFDIGADEYLTVPLKAKKINKLKNKNKKYRFKIFLKPASDQVDTIITKVRQRTKAGKWGKWKYKQTKDVSSKSKSKYTIGYKKKKLKYNRQSQIRVRFKNDAGSSGWKQKKFTTAKKK